MLTELISQTEGKELEPADIGRLLGTHRSHDPNAERQSYYDARDGTKRVWLHDAERWAARLGGRLTVRFTDPWAQLDAAINDLPTDQASLKRSLRALAREHRRPTGEAPPRQRSRAAASSE